jgi:hypothetical protein
MKLYVLFAQRKERYEGQYGLEALAVMTEYDADANPDYLAEQKSLALKTDDFDSLEIVTIRVHENEVYSILYPERKEIEGNVIDEKN